MLRVSNPVGAVANSGSHILYHPIGAKHKLFDFIYKDEKDEIHVFQVTLGKTHSAMIEHIQELKNAVGDTKVHLYYLVPSNNFETFTADPVDLGSKVDCAVLAVMIKEPKAPAVTGT